MLRVTSVHAESARYAASLLFLPELWTPAEAWLPVASFLGHRGWESQLIHLRDAGDLRARVESVMAAARRLPHPPILIGHGAGAIVALDAARAGAASAAILVAPLVPGSAPVGVLTRRWDAIAASLLGRAIPPPRGASARRIFGESPEGLDVEPARAVFDVVRGRLRTFRPLDVPTLVVVGTHDPLLPPDAAAALAAALGAEHAEIAGAAHWPILAPAWQRTADAVHRWLVQRLGEPLLELYAEMMAERDAAETDDE
jgi:pimeloyl-ACP methyl ester carboxylesterase